MPAIPSYCARCNKHFQDNSIVVEGCSNLTMSGNTTSCPYCGGRASMAEGDFSVNEDGLISIISAPHITREMLEEFDLLVREAARDNISEETLKSEADKIDPAFRVAVQRVSASGFKGGLKTLLITTAAAMGTCTATTEKTLDINQAIGQLTGRYPQDISVQLDELPADLPDEPEKKEKPKSTTKSPAKKPRHKNSI